MPERVGKYTIKISNNINIHSSVGIVGKKEGEGPLGEYFDKVFKDNMLGQDSWEKAESTLQTTAVDTLLGNLKLQASDIDVIFAGDLLNQCISSTFGLRALDIPLLGQFGACSTMAQTLAIASVFVDSGAANRAVAVTSSHFCTAERQFRFPIEYGGQRTPTAQWTVTGSGAALIDKDDVGPYVRNVTIGKINDLNIKDANNMGAAMAPAAADTIFNYLSDTNTKPEDYDMILTGDLGKIGSELLKEILLRDGIDISQNHNDCGLMIYDLKRQDVHAGGSGCGCSGSVFCSYIMQKLKSCELKNILFVATGALMSPTSSQQGESIPGIAHLLNICCNTTRNE